MLEPVLLPSTGKGPVVERDLSWLEYTQMGPLNPCQCMCCRPLSSRALVDDVHTMLAGRPLTHAFLVRRTSSWLGGKGGGGKGGGRVGAV